MYYKTQTLIILKVRVSYQSSTNEEVIYIFTNENRYKNQLLDIV